MFRFHVKFFLKTHMVDDDAFLELEAIFLGHFLFFWNDKFITFMMNLRDVPPLWELNRCSPNYYIVNTCHDYHHMLVFVCSYSLVLTFFKASVIWVLYGVRIIPLNQLVQ